MNETFLKRNKETSRPWNRANPDQGQMEQSGDVTTFYLYMFLTTFLDIFFDHIFRYIFDHIFFFITSHRFVYILGHFSIYIFNLIFVYIFVHFFIYIFELSDQPNNQSKTKQSNYQKNQTKESSGK